MSPVTISITDHLRLQSWEPSHAGQLFALVDVNRAQLQEWLPWVPGVKTTADSLSFITDAIQDRTTNSGLELGIWEDDVLVGCIGLHELNFTHKKTSFGYWLGAESQGKGVMSRSVTALIDYCVTELGFDRLEIRAAVGNEKSAAIPKRLGFTEEGILRQAELINGKFVDNRVFSLLAIEWKSRK